MKNKFLSELQERGYLNQCTDLQKLANICDEKSIIGYIGFDCTASSLHVGSLLQIMVLKLMQKHGHRPIVLLGGGTTLIGDPSGKDTTRKILNESEIKKNIDLGRDLIGRDHEYYRVDIDFNFPKYLTKNKDKYKDWIK